MVSAGVDLELAVVGGGAAGTSVADAMKRARPEWSIALFERTNRIGGRLMSVPIEGLDYPIELGGMRFLTSHTRISSMVDAFGLRSHPFDSTGDGTERTYLRGVLGAGPSDAQAGRGYDLAPDHAGRSAAELAEEVVHADRPRLPWPRP